MTTSPQWPAVHLTEVVSGDDGLQYEQVVSSPVCDFCGDQNPSWDYDCNNFDIEEIGFGSWGAWACCNTCSEFIETGDYEALLERAIDNPLGRDNPDWWRERIGLIHDGFSIHRIGERVAFG